MLKNVAEMLLAMARPIMVLPVPGGPNRSSPFAGARAPCKFQIPNDSKFETCSDMVCCKYTYTGPNAEQEEPLRRSPRALHNLRFTVIMVCFKYFLHRSNAIILLGIHTWGRRP